MGLILKLSFVVVFILVALNIFLPDRAEEAIQIISENTGITEEKIIEGVELATDIAKDSVDLAKEKVTEVVE